MIYQFWVKHQTCTRLRSVPFAHLESDQPVTAWRRGRVPDRFLFAREEVKLAKIAGTAGTAWNGSKNQHRGCGWLGGCF